MAEALVAARLDSGESLLFEVDEPDDFGVTAVSISVDPETGTVELGSALSGVKRAAAQVLETMRSIADPPDSCEISFGVKLSGTVGAIIAKASTEANFTIKLTWTKKNP
jgi:hypothetical protein